MNNIFENNQADGKERACPVCGHSDLRSYVLREVRQTDNGFWEYSTLSDDAEEIDALTAEMNNVNMEVRCRNTFCGPMTHPIHNIPSAIETPDQLFKFYINEICEDPPVVTPAGLPLAKSDICLGDMDRPRMAIYEEFVSEIRNIPWSGVIGDCIIII